MKSSFDSDLSKEALLGKYLDDIYPDKFKGFNIQRVSDSEHQHKGVDLVISKGNMEFYIDEKAQLDYIEKDLPTFAFEITYIKDNNQKQGWLFDKHKVTDRYFTITAITCNEYYKPESGFKSCKITSVDRVKLIQLLESRGLTYERIVEINQEIRKGTAEGKIPVNELNHSEGNFHYSTQKVERPINIVLKLQFLIDSGVAKSI